MKILLLSPYDATSHRYWHEALVRGFPQHEFTVVTLPARHFSWRIRGNPLTLASDSRVSSPFDAVIATSMTDLATLGGLVPTIAATPRILYFHENQFAYPDNTDSRHQADRQITTIYAALAADKLVFNSDYNRQTFLEGAAALLQKMPDHVPDGLIDAMSNRAQVIPVPLAEDIPASVPTREDTLFTLVWNHRWEHDKGPDTLYEITRRLVNRGVSFRMHLLGDTFGGKDPSMERVVQLLRDTGHAGHIGRAETRQLYLELLRESHCVLSTARHEFQGISVQEGMACGCIPVVPDALAYPEYVTAENRYSTLQGAVDRIEALAKGNAHPDTSRLPRGSDIRLAWLNLLESLTRR